MSCRSRSALQPGSCSAPAAPCTCRPASKESSIEPPTTLATLGRAFRTLPAGSAQEAAMPPGRLPPAAVVAALALGSRSPLSAEPPPALWGLGSVGSACWKAQRQALEVGERATGAGPPTSGNRGREQG